MVSIFKYETLKYLTVRYGALLLSFLFFFIIPKGLEVEEFYEYSLVTLYTSYLTFLTLGMEHSIIFLLSRNRELTSNGMLFMYSIISISFLHFLIALLTLILNKYFHWYSMSFIGIIFVYSFFTSNLLVSNNLLRHKKYMAIVGFGNSLIFALPIIYYFINSQRISFSQLISIQIIAFILTSLVHVLANKKTFFIPIFKKKLFCYLLALSLSFLIFNFTAGLSVNLYSCCYCHA